LPLLTAVCCPVCLSVTHTHTHTLTNTYTHIHTHLFSPPRHHHTHTHISFFLWSSPHMHSPARRLLSFLFLSNTHIHTHTHIHTTLSVCVCVCVLYICVCVCVCVCVYAVCGGYVSPCSRPLHLLFPSLDTNRQSNVGFCVARCCETYAGMDLINKGVHARVCCMCLWGRLHGDFAHPGALSAPCTYVS
jgi:hypothetical protein